MSSARAGDDEEQLLIAQIETAAGAEQVEALAGVEGIAGIRAGG